MSYWAGHRHTDKRMQFASIRIAVPPEQVWNQITDVAGIVGWYDTWDRVEHAADDERLKLGTLFRLVRHHIGGDDIAVCRVTALDAPRRLGWVQSTAKRPSMLVEFELLPEGTTGTLLNHTKTTIESTDY